MALLLKNRKDEEKTLFVNSYREIYDKLAGFELVKVPKYKEIKAYLEPMILQDDICQIICIPCPVTPIDDTASRSATWNALYTDRQLPDIEEKAVDKYAGSLDAYLPDNIPIDTVLKHAKG